MEVIYMSLKFDFPVVRLANPKLSAPPIGLRYDVFVFLHGGGGFRGAAEGPGKTSVAQVLVGLAKSLAENRSEKLEG